MAKYSSVNYDGTIGGREALFELKTVLKSAGWTVPQSSDGLTYNSSGDQITHAGVGANGINNNYAWYVIRDPGDSHEWCFQMSTTSYDNRVKISALDRFTGGSPDATTVPSATDEKILLGGGTDASPTFATLFPSYGSFRYHIIAQSDAVGTSPSVYGFWSFSTDETTGAYYTMICQDPIDPDTITTLEGTRLNPTLGDADPVVYICGADLDVAEIGTAAGAFGSASPVSSAWFQYNLDGGRFGSIGISFISGFGISGSNKFQGFTSSDGLGVNPYTGDDDMLPIIWVAPRTFHNYPSGWKGVSKYLRSRTVWRSPDYPNTLNLSSNSYVCLGDLLIPWEDNTTPL